MKEDSKQKGESKAGRDEKGRFLAGTIPNSTGHNQYTRVKEQGIRVKMSFLEVFDRLGGADGLYEWALKRGNRKEFYKMVLPLIPKDINVEGDGVAPKYVTLLHYGNNGQSELEEEYEHNRERIHSSTGDIHTS